MNPGVRTGEYYITGDVACAEGAIAAGCTFFGAYPITPATEIAEHMAERLPDVGGTFIQMEDEIAAIASILGAAWTGAKSMTATSGPGFSLMMENLGLAVCTETPCVIVNVQRTGPSTGLPTMTGQADMMQARWGSHGDYELIALAPSSPQDCFYQTIRAFNLSEKYRVPVLIMADEIVGHMSEKVVIPEAGKIRLVDRPRPTGRKDRFKLFEPGPNGVAPMPAIGDGYNIHVTGLTHDERGYPVTTNAEAHASLVERLVRKVEGARREIADYEIVNPGAEVVFVCYGAPSRAVAQLVADRPDEEIGVLRLRLVWPFPDHALAEFPDATAFVVPEQNLGQIASEVERHTDRPVVSAPKIGGELHTPAELGRILEEVRRR